MRKIVKGLFARFRLKINQSGDRGTAIPPYPQLLFDWGSLSKQDGGKSRTLAKFTRRPVFFLRASAHMKNTGGKCAEEAMWEPDPIAVSHLNHVM